MTKEVYNLIISIKDRLHDFDEDKPSDVARLYKMGYLEHYHYSKDGKSIFAWRLTNTAVKEMEEYEKSLRQQEREIKSLQIAEEANKKADKANKISKSAIIVSVIVSTLTVLASVLIAIFVKS